MPQSTDVKETKLKLTFLGTCSGTEPIAGYRHTSFVIEHAGGVYWFDAG